MHFSTLVTIGLATTGALAQWRMKREQPAHGIEHVSSVRSEATEHIEDHIWQTPDGGPSDQVAVVAFYSQPQCQGVPSYLRAKNVTCYGPISNQATFSLVAANPDCQVMVRRHPCGSDNAATILNTDGLCFAGNSLPQGLDIWVQCGVPEVTQGPGPDTASPTPTPSAPARRWFKAKLRPNDRANV